MLNYSVNWLLRVSGKLKLKGFTSWQCRLPAGSSYRICSYISMCTGRRYLPETRVLILAFLLSKLTNKPISQRVNGILSGSFHGRFNRPTDLRFHRICGSEHRPDIYWKADTGPIDRLIYRSRPGRKRSFSKEHICLFISKSVTNRRMILKDTFVEVKL